MKAQMLADADDMRRRIAETREIGDLLTGGIIAQGTRVLRSIAFRNENPIFPPIFLTFLDHRE